MYVQICTLLLLYTILVFFSVPCKHEMCKYTHIYIYIYPVLFFPACFCFLFHNSTNELFGFYIPGLCLRFVFGWNFDQSENVSERDLYHETG